MRRRSVIRDTIQMTVIQFFLECLALLFNAWMTRRVGAATVGTLALAGSFFNLAAMVAGGNAMLCASRFVSEELGKSCGCPAQILRNAVRFCLLLSVPVSAGIFAFAEPLSRQFLQSTAMAQAVRLMALLLPLGSISACLKGYFNAVCRVTVTAGCDVAEFLLRAGLLTGLLLWHRAAKPEQVCTYLVGSMAAGTLFSTAVLLLLYVRKREPCRGKCSLSFGTYIRLAVPVAFGGCLTAALSTANDTLIPMTLRQFGDSTSRALQQFGTFEGIVIPVLFFPSTILCALSGILIPEVARANAAGNRERVCRLTERVIELTLIFAVLISAVLLKYGGVIGRCMDGGELSGRMIRIFAPVVPFIYLEIVLEALIKGMGKQNFSSLNYLAEYVIRICVVLICIPLFGFYGIVASYYTSNVFGNCNRLRMAVKTANLRFRFGKLIGKPVFAVGFAFAAASLPEHFCPQLRETPLGIAVFLGITLSLYGLVLRLLRERRDITRGVPVRAVSAACASGDDGCVPFHFCRVHGRDCG